MAIKKTKKTIKKEVKVITKAMAKPVLIKEIKKAFSKSELAQAIAGAIGINKKQAIAAIGEFTRIIALHLAKGGPGVFVFPGVAKFRTIKKPATKAKEGKNPFTGKPMTFAAKPARNVVKIRALKRLKEMAK